MLITIAALVIAAQAPAPPPDPDCLVLFSRAAILARASEAVCVRGDPAQRGEFLLRHTATDRRGTSTTRSTSTGACPAARTELLQLEGLTLPTLDVPGMGRELQAITLDGAGYRLKVQALYDGDAADLTLESNVDTPLARWIDSALGTLSACWRDAGS